MRIDWSHQAELRRLCRARMPSCLMAPSPLGAAVDELVLVDIDLADGRIADIRPSARPTAVRGHRPRRAAGAAGDSSTCIRISTRAISGRGRPIPTARSARALDDSAADRRSDWTRGGRAARVDFALRCCLRPWHRGAADAYRFGAARRRTSWPRLRPLREGWRGRIELQAVSLSYIEDYRGACRRGSGAARRRAWRRPGWLPADGSRPRRPISTGCSRWRRASAAISTCTSTRAATPLRVSLEHVAAGHAAPRLPAPGRRRPLLLAGACSPTTRRCARSTTWPRPGSPSSRCRCATCICRIGAAGRTPRWRGVTLLHEMQARGIPVAVASDNTRDPFYAYGDLDMLEVFREATRIVHLDHPVGDWPQAVTATPAKIMGLAGRGAHRRRRRRPISCCSTAARLDRIAVAARKSDRIVCARGMADRHDAARLCRTRRTDAWRLMPDDRRAA